MSKICQKLSHYRLISMLAIGSIGLGVAYYMKNRLLDPDQLLQATKDRIIRQETVTGSWISYIPETVTKDGQLEQIYHGAIQVVQGERPDGTPAIANYHFTINAKTGKLYSFEETVY